MDSSDEQSAFVGLQKIIICGALRDLVAFVTI